MMVHGTHDPAFAAVRDAFAHAIDSGDDLGGAVAVHLDGRPVVDLWGGLADAKTGRAWERDTACVTFSCTKAVTATAALLLAERGLVDLAAPVTRWWPEFAGRGKDGITGTHLLTHQAGLPAFDRDIGIDEAANPAAMAAELAGESPQWVPGTAHGYHALTFGWLVGELVRRHAGTSVAEFVRAELGADLWLGVPADRIATIARLSAGRPGKPDELPASLGEVARLVEAYNDPDSAYRRSTGNPAASFNKPEVLAAGWPAAGLITTARGFAVFASRLVAAEIIGRSTLRDAVREWVRGADRTLVLESAFGLGYMLPSANMFLPEIARASAFGHPGASGALVLGDLECGLGFAYLPNLTRPGLGDRRAYRLVQAVYESL